MENSPQDIDPAEAAKILGNEAFNAKKYDEAIEHYSAAIKLNPDKGVYYSNRSACYAAKQMWQQSLDDALQCVAKDSKFLKGYLRLATAQIELKYFDDADATLKSAVPFDTEGDQIPKVQRQLRLKRQAAQKKAPKQLDENQKKELLELQDQMNIYSKDLQVVQAKIFNAQRDSRANNATVHQITDLQETVPMYRSVGKAFILSNKGGVMEHLENENESLMKLQRDLLDRQEYLERRIASTTSNMKEIISSE